MTPPLSHTRPDGIRVAILTCGDLGLEVANALTREAGVRDIAVLRSPWRRKPLTLPQKFRHVIRTQGLLGPLHVAGARLLPEPRFSAPATRIQPGVMLVDVDDFHSTSAREALRLLRCDLGVLAGTYILRDGVYDIPRYGSINLHSGKAPEYRGAAPAFWELYNGETEVGITIHRVAAALDAGDVFRQEVFPLDTAPEGDPMAYIDRYRREVLRPNGVRMLAHVVRDIAAGTAITSRQDHSAAMTYRAPDHKAILELRSRIRGRRSAA